MTEKEKKAVLIVDSLKVYYKDTSKFSEEEIEEIQNKNKELKNGLKQIYANLEILDISGCNEVLKELLEEKFKREV